MKFTNSIKDKLHQTIGNETIGELGFDKERSQDSEPIAPNKKKKNKFNVPKISFPESKPKVKRSKEKKSKEKKEKPKKSLTIPKPVEFNQSNTKQTTNPNHKKSYPVLDLLGIARNVNISGLMTSQVINDVEFTLEAPTGLNPSQVENFLKKVEIDLDRYVAIIHQRQHDFEILLDEIVRLEQVIIEKQQESELANFIIDKQSNEEKLKEELLDLRIENRELKSQLNDLLKNLKSKEKELEKEKMNHSEPMKELVKTIESKIVSSDENEETNIKETILSKPFKPIVKNIESDDYDDLESLINLDDIKSSDDSDFDNLLNQL